MICPKCKKEHNDGWPIEVDSEIKDGGCQDCWEAQSDAMWWKMVEVFEAAHGERP